MIYQISAAHFKEPFPPNRSQGCVVQTVPNLGRTSIRNAVLDFRRLAPFENEGGSKA